MNFRGRLDRRIFHISRVLKFLMTNYGDGSLQPNAKFQHNISKIMSARPKTQAWTLGVNTAVTLSSVLQ